MIIRPNLISILLGWEELTCFLLFSNFFKNVKSYNSGISNRIKNVILLIAIRWILNYGRWTFFFI